jgi:hypothetical protein
MIIDPQYPDWLECLLVIVGWWGAMESLDANTIGVNEDREPVILNDPDRSKFELRDEDDED